MPTVVLEAMAAARPVLVSDVGATAALVDRTNGYLLPKGDAHALVDAIEHIGSLAMDDRAGLGRSGHARAIERFQWMTVAQRFLRTAGRLAGKPIV